MRLHLAGAGTAICALLGSAILAGCGGGGSTSSQQMVCVPHFAFTNAKVLGTGFDVIDQEEETNASNVPASYTFTSKHGQTISVEQSTVNGFDAHAQVAEAGLKVDPMSTKPLSAEAGRAVFNYVHETDSSVQDQFTVQAGAQVTWTIPPGATGYALYGAIVKVTRGTLLGNGCATASQDGKQTVLVPVSYYSCTWSRGPDVFTSGGQVPSSCGTIVAYDPGQ